MTDKNKKTLDDESPKITENEEVDVDTLKQALAEEKEKSEKYMANWQRAEADFINYKKRTEQAKQDLVSFANSVLILNLLPVMDDLDRAFNSLPSKLEKLDWVNGIRHIQHKLHTIMESQGLSQIECIGKCFDPCFHEAVAHLEGEEGIVISEVQKGFQLKDKILRPSHVVVGKGNETKVEEEAEKPNE